MRTLLAVALGIVAVGAWRTRAPSAPTAPAAIVPAEPSYVFSHVRPAGLDVARMTATYLSPSRDEALPAACLERFDVITGDGYGTHVRPLLDAVGPLRFPLDAESGTPLVLAVAREIDGKWEALRRLAGRAPGVPRLRVMVKQYPRGDLPGRCVTVQVLVYDVLDPHLDGPEAFGGLVSSGDGIDVPGGIVDLRRTYRLDGAGAPRLVEAHLEAHVRVRFLHDRGRLEVPDLLPDANVPGDAQAGDHFLPFGGGVRVGLLWVDRAFGGGRPDPHAIAYRFERTSARAAPHVVTAPLPPPVAARLRTLLSRA